MTFIATLAIVLRVLGNTLVLPLAAWAILAACGPVHASAEVCNAADTLSRVERTAGMTADDLLQVAEKQLTDKPRTGKPRR
ncbi:hypothetical protein [Planomonospora parontospora]|uniref:hypothetical protein n=1 Tax=Planomonospora parontospora TaxID=58119 RepID=UPI00166F8279|nr:hypothetical protein [Planomonospora parontospora]GGL15372.1 hypothetical protein GCM10014719_16770 [Planomonospora parontospora subsp. antibiotica]GII15951.1 hypothetical protein Ppa05_26770 [Planomonospora parontospora subsp. antibiotica]